MFQRSHDPLVAAVLGDGYGLATGSRMIGRGISPPRNTRAARFHLPLRCSKQGPRNNRGKIARGSRIWGHCYGLIRRNLTSVSKTGPKSGLCAAEINVSGFIADTCWPEFGAWHPNLLLSCEMQAFSRGTHLMPGVEVLAGADHCGYETAVLENADSDTFPNTTSRDGDGCGASARLHFYREANGDDLVKIILTWPAGVKPTGASMKWLHDGMPGDATPATAYPAVGVGGDFRWNISQADLILIFHLSPERQIAGLANASPTHKLSHVLADNEMASCREAARRFGDLSVDPITRLGGGLWKREWTLEAAPANLQLLVYGDCIESEASSRGCLVCKVQLRC